MLEKRLYQKLQERDKAGNLRTLTTSAHLIDFCSNDYLGLASNPTLAQQVLQSLASMPAHRQGATGSRLVSGTSPYALNLEKYLAVLFQAENALLFNSGYQANTAILSTIPQKGDTIICDALIHASLREGARLSFAQNYYFKHNDLEDLEKKLQKATGEKFVVIESVYSMDGDFGELDAIAKICNKYLAHLIIDEAHSTGIFGKNGNGFTCQKNLESVCFARIYTFGKAIGGHGACIVGSKILIDYLINFARAFIYTTALPLHTLVSIYEAFEFLKQNPRVSASLHKKIELFKTQMQFLQQQDVISLKESNSPIQILKIGGNKRTKYFAEEVQKLGYDVRPILSPTVKKGEEILRICLHSFNTNQEIHGLTTCLQHIYNQISSHK